MSVEPLMLLDGLAFSNMHVYMENLQMDRVCRVSCGLTEAVCGDLRSHTESSVEVQRRFSVFALYNGIIAAALPLFFILFMGAWSDKYGRRVPLLAVQFAHALHAFGYLLVSLAPNWPVEVILGVTLLDTLGGGAVSFLTAANAYLGDVTPEHTRTSRISLANSIWFLGGPLGTLMALAEKTPVQLRDSVALVYGLSVPAKKKIEATSSNSSARKMLEASISNSSAKKKALEAMNSNTSTKNILEAKISNSSAKISNSSTKNILEATYSNSSAKKKALEAMNSNSSANNNNNNNNNNLTPYNHNSLQPPPHPPLPQNEDHVERFFQSPANCRQF
ncbi:hypothetical protein Pcinc_034447 [Petrolisthes cinctipes]|uniref:Uncharacterized protein n=1 Tax=Petrolisthes cinctipes TaxID=88211 RepID=A0AAE1JZ66_PETCI|nr:hypothetical protein Pcinc_034447 [Petrolisthes cinctipes]